MRSNISSYRHDFSIAENKSDSVIININIYMETNDRIDGVKLTEKLIETPFTLLQDKLDIIAKVCAEHNVKDLLEVGSFSGGSAYILGKLLPSASIKSIDINNFADFFSTSENDNILLCITNYFPGLEPQDLIKIQSFYNSQLPNIDIETGVLTNLDISTYDAIILDGDHDSSGIHRDLTYVLKNNNKCIIFVDDTSYEHIKTTVDSICNKKLKHLKLHYVYNGDLAVITRRNKI